MMKPSEKSESEEYMMGDAYRVAKQAYDKKDKTMTTRDAGLTQEQVEAAEVRAAGRRFISLRRDQEQERI
jgi:hypothetical protein